MNSLKARLVFDTFKYSFKRKDSTKKILYSLIAIIVSLIIAGCITAMVGYNPFEMIAKLFTKAFEFEPKKLLYNIVVLSLAGLSFSFAFKANIFNIGISGQMFSAGITMLIISNSLDNFDINPFLGQTISFITCVITAGFFAWLIAIMDRYLKVNPVVSGILLNWILYLIGFFVVSSWYPNTLEGNAIMTASIDIPEEFRLMWGSAGSWLPMIVITLIIAIGMLITFKYTTIGKKMISIGLSPDGSRYLGFNVSKIKILTFTISGAIAGVLALVIYTAQVPEIPLTDLNVNVPAEGFNGIAIGLLASNNPIGIIFVSGILGLFKTSSSYLWEKPVFNDVIIGVLILVIVIFTLLEKYKPWYGVLNKKYKAKLDEEYIQFELKLNELISLTKIKLYEIKKSYGLKNQSKIKELKQEYLDSLYKLKNEYYESLIKGISTNGFNPKYLIENEKRLAKKYYEKDLSTYLSKQRNKLSFIDKINEKLLSDKFISKAVSKFTLSRNEIKMLGFILRNNPVTKNKLMSRFENDYETFNSLISRKVISDESNISICLDSEIIKEIYFKRNIIRKFISNRRVKILIRIKEANSKTKKWIQESSNLIDKKYRNVYKKSNADYITIIFNKEIVTNYKQLYNLNNICKNIINKKIKNETIKNNSLNIILSSNERVNEEGIW